MAFAWFVRELFKTSLVHCKRLSHSQSILYLGPDHKVLNQAEYGTIKTHSFGQETQAYWPYGAIWCHMYVQLIADSNIVPPQGKYGRRCTKAKCVMFWMPGHVEKCEPTGTPSLDRLQYSLWWKWRCCLALSMRGTRSKHWWIRGHGEADVLCFASKNLKFSHAV